MSPKDAVKYEALLFPIGRLWVQIPDSEMSIRFHAFHGSPKSFQVDTGIIYPTEIRRNRFLLYKKARKFAIVSLLCRYGVCLSPVVLLSAAQTERYLMCCTAT
jgi:hypothetical protein